jgi:N-dimethylarginine dimethylaminohydrolase
MGDAEMTDTAQSEIGAITRLLFKHPRDAFGNAESIARQWRDLNFTAPPDLPTAIDEYDRFLSCLNTERVALHALPAADGTTLDSIYVRDASVVCNRGAILCRMGKPAREHEPRAQRRAFEAIGCPVAGEIVAPGRLEGGDVLWLDHRTVVVGRGYRTNDSGITQLRALLGTDIERLIVVPLPHWRGTSDVFHLMSIISPVDADLAVVYSPLMPVPFREFLLDRGMSLIEVPDEEFATMGANVLAIGPRRALMLRGNPTTRRKLEEADAEVIEYDGAHISMMGGGGPTCLTRPLLRADPSGA